MWCKKIMDNIWGSEKKNWGKGKKLVTWDIRKKCCIH